MKKKQIFSIQQLFKLLFQAFFLYYLPSMNLVKSAHDSKSSHTFKAKTIVHDFGTTELKKAPKRSVILDNLYAEILEPLDLTPVDATTEQEGSQEFSTLFKKHYKDADVVSVGWQKTPDLEKIKELKPDLILMTVDQEGLYDKLSEISPTVGYRH